MCTRAAPAAPSDPAQALAMVRAGLGYLAGCDAAGLPTAAQAEALAGLEAAEAQHTAARARVLAAFTVQRGYEADGQYGAKAWLRAVTKVTRGAAAAAVGWARRLQEHPVLAAALAEARVPASLARQICAWTDQIPGEHRDAADQILLDAALGGAGIHDLAALAREMIERARTRPDPDDDGFADRAVSLDTTLGGAGRLRGDLTGPCAAALQTVLDALSRRTGPEDDRTMIQRRHDALEEACMRLIAASMVPGRDGAPARLLVHVDLAALRGSPGASALEHRWASAPAGGGHVAGAGGWSPAKAAAGPGTAHLAGPEAEAAACDATVVPVVTGQLDHAALDQLTDLYLRLRPLGHRSPARQPGPHEPVPSPPITPAARARLRDHLLRLSLDLLSGPGGLAAALRAHTLEAPCTGRPQPLDVGTPTPVIPGALRHAVTVRDQHCVFPGCDQPPSVCEIHHLIPRSRGGPTSLRNLVLLCRFHHLTAIHRWGWTLIRHPAGTTTATAPDGRTLHSHSPPRHAA